MRPTKSSEPQRSDRCICGLLCALSFASYQPDAMTTSDALFWYVAHTRPRREKKLAEYCEREGFRVTLPCYRAVHKYRGKTVTFRKPLFPGYVFLQLLVQQRQKVYQSDYVANLLDVPDQETFAHQLGDILQALETDLEVCLAPQITAGARVRIKSGPLRGLEGCVQERAGVTMVLLRLDFISQAAAVKIDATELEIA
jgi:transcription antitermination factor NusG